MNLKKIIGFVITFWPFLAGGVGLFLLPVIDWAWFGGGVIGAGLSILTTRFQSGEWPWLGPRYQG